MMQEEVYSEPPTGVIDMIETIIDNYKSDLHDNQCNSLTDYLKKNNSEEELVSIIRTMNSCYCCTRHQSDKPTCLEEYIDYKYPTQDKNFKCKCNCRQIVRHCCRAKFGIKQNWVCHDNY